MVVVYDTSYMSPLLVKLPLLHPPNSLVVSKNLRSEMASNCKLFFVAVVGYGVVCFKVVTNTYVVVVKELVRYRSDVRGE